MHTARIVGMALAALAVTGCAAPTDSEPAEPTSKPGTAGEWEIIGRPVIKNELGAYGGTIRAKNTSDTGRVALITMTVLKGQKVLGTLECLGTGSEVAPGASTTLRCVSTDKYQKGWTRLALEDAGF